MLATVVMSVAAVIAVAILIAFLLIYKKNKDTYEEYLEPLDPKIFTMKKYLGTGLYMSEKLAVLSHIPDAFQQPVMQYENKVRSKVGELYGAAYQDYYYQIHVAIRWLMGLLGIFFCSIFSLAIASGGDWKSGMFFIVCIPFAAVGLPLLQDKNLDGKIEDRRTKLRLEFPEFINKLVLLVNAGMTIPKAWEKIADEMTENTPLSRELQFCMMEIRSGKPVEVAYEEFGRRCRIKEIIKFVSVIILNMRKGGNELVLTLQAQSSECWEMRKSAARRLGEEASSKMMLPMAIMLLGIMMVVALPAVLSIMSM
jgi:tight adherence protein C